MTQTIVVPVVVPSSNLAERSKPMPTNLLELIANVITNISISKKILRSSTKILYFWRESKRIKLFIKSNEFNNYLYFLEYQIETKLKNNK